MTVNICLTRENIDILQSGGIVRCVGMNGTEDFRFRIGTREAIEKDINSEQTYIHTYKNYEDVTQDEQN